MNGWMDANLFFIFRVPQQVISCLCAIIFIKIMWEAWFDMLLPPAIASEHLHFWFTLTQNLNNKKIQSTLYSICQNGLCSR